MKCAIMQPTYFPWAGFFNLIDSVDVFVFLDNVQFNRRSWQSRNRIMIDGNIHWLSVPTVKAKRDELIKNIKIDNSQDWRKQHLKKIRHAYSKYTFGREVVEIVEDFLFSIDQNYLSDLNIKTTIGVAKLLSINKFFIRSSNLGLKGKRSDLLHSICVKLECNEYISPFGSKKYLLEDGVFFKSGIELSYQNFVPENYAQNNCNKFISNLSIIDVIANVGVEGARSYIRS